MFRRKETAETKLKRCHEHYIDTSNKLAEARLTISLLLDARLPQVVQPKRMVRECIDPTLKKRAFAAINRRPEG